MHKMQCYLVLILCISLTSSTYLDIATVKTIYPIEAVQGGLANLPCDITPPEAGDKMQILIWYKGKIPIYTFDCRGKTSDTGKHWSDELGFGNRGFFRYQDDPAKLMIESVKESDGGVYQCRVDFRRSPTRNVVVNLTVIIPPNKIQIFNGDGSEISHYVIGPYNEGSSINISCISSGGRPLPKVTWWQENALLDDTYEFLQGNKVKNVLRLDRLSRKYLHTVFTCQSSNNNLIAPISNSVTLDMNLRPLSVKIDGTSEPLSAGRYCEVRCIVVGSRPLPRITWWKRGVQLTNTRETTSPDFNVTTSTLTFVPEADDGGKIVSCKVHQPLILQSSLEDTWKLNVYYKPSASLKLGNSLNADLLKEGDDVYFECNIKSNPWVYKVSWRHNGNMLYSNISAGVLISNQTLVLQNLNRRKSGSYTCVGSNEEGEGASNAIQLDVKSQSINYVCVNEIVLFLDEVKSVCKSNQQAIYNVALHETVQVSCEVEANPEDVKFFWKFNNTDNSALILDIPQNLAITNKTKSVLLYTPMTEHDYGTLLCKGENIIGQQREPCLFHINPAGKPDPLTNCSVVNQSINSIEVECIKGFDGGLAQIFVLEAYDLKSRKLISNVTSKYSNIIVDSLKPNQTLDLILYASNRIGRSRITRLQSSTLYPIEARFASASTFLQLTPVLGALIGVVAAFILVAIIIVVVIRIRGDDNNSNKNYDSASVSGSAYASVDSKNTSTEPLRTELNNSVNSLEEKDPDIIPHNNGEEIHRDEEKAFDRLNNTLPMSYLRLQSLNRFDIDGDRNFESLPPKINKVTSLFYGQPPASCLQSLNSPHLSTPYRMHNPSFIPGYISHSKENQCVSDGSITSTTPLISRESSVQQPLLRPQRIPIILPSTQSQIVTRF